MKIITDFLSDLLFTKECPFSFFEYKCDLNNTTQCNLCKYEFIQFTKEIREDFKAIDKAFSASKYIEPAKTIVHNLKWNNQDLSLHIAKLMAENIPSNIDAIINIPSLKTEERNWSPSELLANQIAKISNITHLTNIITKDHSTDFFGISKQDRIERLKDCYRLDDRNKNKLKSQTNILLVDDLMASGLSLETGAKLLKSINPNLHITAYTFCSSRAEL